MAFGCHSRKEEKVRRKCLLSEKSSPAVVLRIDNNTDAGFLFSGMHKKNHFYRYPLRIWLNCRIRCRRRLLQIRSKHRPITAKRTEKNAEKAFDVQQHTLRDCLSLTTDFYLFLFLLSSHSVAQRRSNS